MEKKEVKMSIDNKLIVLIISIFLLLTFCFIAFLAVPILYKENEKARQEQALTERQIYTQKVDDEYESCMNKALNDYQKRYDEHCPNNVCPTIPPRQIDKTDGELLSAMLEKIGAEEDCSEARSKSLKNYR